MKSDVKTENQMNPEKLCFATIKKIVKQDANKKLK